MDDRIRIRLFRAIYQYPALQKYELGVQKPIRIIVKNGHVTLEGVVDNDADKNLAGIRANGVSSTCVSTNNLAVRQNPRKAIDRRITRRMMDIACPGRAKVAPRSEGIPDTNANGAT